MRHGFAGRAIALAIFVIGERDCRHRPEKAHRRHPLHGSGRLGQGVVVILARRQVQRPMEHHIVGSAARNRIDRQGQRSGDLADALKSDDIGRVQPQMPRQPVGSYSGDAILDRVIAGRGKQRRGDETVDLVRREASIGNRSAGGFQRRHAQRPAGLARRLAVREADQRNLIARLEQAAHASCSKRNAGTATPGAMSSNSTTTRTDIQRRVSAVEQPRDKPHVGMTVEFHVDEHERVLETGKERTPNHGPCPHPARAVDRHEGEVRLDGMAMRTGQVGRQGDFVALRALRQRQHMARSGLPERRRKRIGHRDGTGSQSGHCRFFLHSRSERLGQSQHVRGDVAEDQVGRNRRDLIEPRLAKLALDVAFLGETEAAVGLDRHVGV